MPGAANWAVSNGNVNGYDFGIRRKAFGLDDPIEFGQMLAVTASYSARDEAASSDLSQLSVFSDAGDVSGWARHSVFWAKARGIASGYVGTDGVRSLRPNENVTHGARRRCHRERLQGGRHRRRDAVRQEDGSALRGCEPGRRDCGGAG